MLLEGNDFANALWPPASSLQALMHWVQRSGRPGQAERGVVWRGVASRGAGRAAVPSQRRRVAGLQPMACKADGTIAYYHCILAHCRSDCDFFCWFVCLLRHCNVVVEGVHCESNCAAATLKNIALIGIASSLPLSRLHDMFPCDCFTF